VINPETIKLPVWVVGVGLVHVAALALVLPMLITLPAPTGNDRNVEAVDVELVPAAQPASKIEQDVEQTAALPSSPQPKTAAAEERTSKPVDQTSQATPEPVPEVTKKPEVEAASQPVQEQPLEDAAPRPAEETAPVPAAGVATKPASEGASEPEGESPTPTLPDAVANAEPEAAPPPTHIEPESAAPPVESDSAPTTTPVEQAEPESKAPAPNPAMVKKPKAAKPKTEAKASKAKAAKPAPKKPAVAAAKPAQHKPFLRRTAQDLARKEPPPFRGPWSQLFGGAPPSPDKR
jgi:hypothetical protein